MTRTVCRILSVPMRHGQPGRVATVVADRVMPEYAESIARHLRETFGAESDPRTFIVHRETDDAEKGTPQKE